eukprot:CAMPEP_0116007332 /NCGR_PEP_ID=MMETSP0321-20121206/2238_1 /TAXON_ID=163516 /ORGANISM="Leptocylindrus danicus var. danicus, Strain B650" /LENGTH=113 /DNA_ID=CAMNT_0003476011 /DNA_START=102 /DNA_END=443 /DNA_ORIENTATION=-
MVVPIFMMSLLTLCGAFSTMYVIVPSRLARQCNYMPTFGHCTPSNYFGPLHQNPQSALRVRNKNGDIEDEESLQDSRGNREGKSKERRGADESKKEKPLAYYSEVPLVFMGLI